MKFNAAVDLYVPGPAVSGRIRPDSTERTYRSILDRHNGDITNRDPSDVGREDVKRTLRRWPSPNTQGVGRAVLVSFYDWRWRSGSGRTTPPERRAARGACLPPSTGSIATRPRRCLLATETRPERWAIYLGICCGLRNAELRGLQGRHFERPGFVWV